MIYFITQHGEDANGLTKIGRAKDPQHRLAGLQVGSPYPLSLVAAFETDDDKAAEDWAQTQLWDLNVRGEWFALLDAIEDVALVQRSGRPSLRRAVGAILDYFSEAA